MIDKVSLRTYDMNTYSILNPLAFTRDTRLKTMGKNWHQNNTTHALPGYHPLVVINRYPNPAGPSGTLQALEIECSLPKVVFQQNLYELKDNDFSTVCNALSTCLHNMGIHMTTTNIARIEVRSIEYSKNFLTGLVPVSYILEELYRAKPINHFMDVQRTAYRNGGEGLVFYCKGYDISFYDKFLEIRNELDQLPAALRHKLINKQANILRMEVRFHDRQTLSAFLKKHKLAPNTQLQDVFSQDISKFVLNYYWEKLSKSARGLSPFVMSPAFELWKTNQGRNAKARIQNKLAKVGVRCLLRKHGYKGALWALERVGDSNPAQTLKKYISKTFRAHKKLNMWKFMDVLLDRFSCLDRARWSKFSPQTRGAWFYDTEPLLNTNQVAQWLHTSISSVRELVNLGYLIARKINNRLLFNRYDILDYLYYRPTAYEA